MLEVRKVDSRAELNQLKAAYFAISLAPLDGMWHFGFVPMSEHFGFYEQDLLVGFCCINAEGYLLEYYVVPEAKMLGCELFSLITQQNSSILGHVKGAYVSTAEPEYLALCLDNSTAFSVNAKMYSQDSIAKKSLNGPLHMTLAKPELLAQFVSFAHDAIAAPESWLSGYYARLIEREELWGYWQGDRLLAVGECRLFDEYQTEYAELGMIVAKSERGKGLATQVLEFLTREANERGLKVICSTEQSNRAAQKAISRAGFMSHHRIVQFTF